MKQLFWIGLVVILLGLASLVVPIRKTENEGFSAGGMSIAMQTHHDETISPVISAVLIMGGAGMMIAAKTRG